MDGVDFAITGAEQLAARLKGITHDLKYKGGRFALRKSATVVKEAAQANAKSLDDPATANEIAANVAIRWSGKTFKRTGDLAFRVGILGGARDPNPPKTAEYSRRARARRGVSTLESLGEIAGKGKGNPGGDTYYWRFLEFGTAKHPEGKPFLRKALSDNISQATDTFVREYGKKLDREIKRGAK